ncbi:MAG: ArsC/Spx/MgsR family protein [Saprospiraceae bacterium]|nr:ArsC/Spx/MgsR family protein [Saprospiraceae bacterium]
MRKIYYLSTCDTCARIIRELGGLNGFIFQDIKENNIGPEALDAIAEQMGSYEALFSRRARKYRSMGLGDQDLSERDYRKLILEEYTFLKRPVIVIGDHVFVGNAKATVQAAQEALEG